MHSLFTKKCDYKVLIKNIRSDNILIWNYSKRVDSYTQRQPTIKNAGKEEEKH